MASGDGITLDRLLARLIDDELTDSELAQLEQILLADPEARAKYRALVKMNALLGARLAGPEGIGLPAELTAEIAAGSKESPSVPAPRQQGEKAPIGQAATVATSSPLTLSYWRARPLRFGSLALALTLLLWAGFYFAFMRDLGPRRRGAGEGREFIAKVVRLQGVRWAADASPVGEGDTLVAGQTLEIADGFVEIHFGRGAVALLEGPASFEIDSIGAGTLQWGRVVARVERPGETQVGFSVSTALAQIIDLGTEFGVEVTADGTTTIEVFEGRVEATRKGGDPRLPPATLRINQGQSARIWPNQQGFEKEEETRVAFVQEMPEEVEGTRIITPASVISSLEEPQAQNRLSQSLLNGDAWLRRMGPVQQWTYYRTAGREIWGVSGSETPCTLTFDLGEVYELDKLWIWNASADQELYYHNNSVKTVQVEVSDTGGDFILLEEIVLQPTSSPQVQAQAFPLGVRARYVRLVVIDGYHDESLLGDAVYSTLNLSQVRFEGKPLPAAAEE